MEVCLWSKQPPGVDTKRVLTSSRKHPFNSENTEKKKIFFGQMKQAKQFQTFVKFDPPPSFSITIMHFDMI